VSQLLAMKRSERYVTLRPWIAVDGQETYMQFACADRLKDDERPRFF